MSAHPIIPRASRLIALLCLVLGLAACTVAEDRQMTFATWQQGQPFPQPQAEWVPISHAVAFAPQSPDVSDIEREALLRFLNQANVQAGDAVVLTVPPPYEGQPDETGIRASALRAVLARYGVLSSTRFGGLPGLSADEILVTAQTLAVVAPECPGYNTPIALDFEQKPAPNFGCATAANLGLMVANPADLIKGRDLPPADGEASTLSIRRYRAGKVIPPANLSTK